MTTQPPGTYEEAPPTRRAPWTLFVVTAVLFVLSMASLVGGVYGFAANGTQEDELQRLDVPGERTFEVEEAGSFTIFYESTSYVDEGVCRRTTTGPDNRPELTCDEQLLRDAGAPVVRPEGGDSIDVVDPGGTLVAFDLDRHLPVWSFTADEPGTYEISFDDAPLGTESISVGPDGDGAPAWAALFLVLFLVLGFATFVMLVVSVVVLLVRLSRPKPPGARPGPPPLPPPPSGAAWAPPAGPPTGVVPPPTGGVPGAPTTF